MRIGCSIKARMVSSGSMVTALSKGKKQNRARQIAATRSRSRPGAEATPAQWSSAATRPGEFQFTIRVAKPLTNYQIKGVDSINDLPTAAHEQPISFAAEHCYSHTVCVRDPDE